jgi:hypothetical protein
MLGIADPAHRCALEAGLVSSRDGA